MSDQVRRDAPQAIHQSAPSTVTRPPPLPQSPPPPPHPTPPTTPPRPTVLKRHTSHITIHPHTHTYFFPSHAAGSSLTVIGNEGEGGVAVLVCDVCIFGGWEGER